MAKNPKATKSIFKATNTQAPMLQRVFSGLYTPENIEGYLGNYDDTSSYYLNQIMNNASQNPLGKDNLFKDVSPRLVATGTDMGDVYDNIENIGTQTGFKTTAGLAGNWIKNHKLKSAGLGLGVGANLAGLFDNPNMAGQLLGGAGAGIGANLLAKHLGSPLTASGTALWALGGGALGSLFDKLMYKKQQEQQQQYY